MLMKFILILTILVTLVNSWDYILFVQVWPASWIAHDKVKYNFTNNYFDIHGLWPQYKNGSWPEFCNKTAKFNISEINDIKTNLTKYWTNFKNPKQFWAHEYLKHMVCASDTYKNPYELFTYGLELRNKYNIYEYLKNNDIVPDNNIKYNVTKLTSVIKKSLGVNTIITCNDGILTEVRLCMTNNFKLFDCPINLYKDQCKLLSIKYNKLKQ